ncbi:MAG: Flagellar transcriptional regulator FtcR [Candidatus Tokpelaia hoelldobleri]|uniref:Flagellar transcriptional regulator FtcR n=1 Tax=Candidatus Tokpelaia hoelldobleri TaxID=1902579 RepID=A0A1U9JSX9_9HYPH|nr:MAG: Flagellar transcriptional regulator FtcR [Candidatus Tokpelaia hoelldoblerii]
MIIFVDERRSVIAKYEALFAREGVSMAGLCPDDFDEWIETASVPDLAAVEAVLLGECQNRLERPKKIRRRSAVPLLALCDNHSLEQTLDLFRSGVDDVLNPTIHVREILARIGAIFRRRKIRPGNYDGVQFGPIRIFNDGRDPEVAGKEMSLPRRERQILEYFVNSRNRRVDKTQIFSAIYGLFNAEVEENVIESHISKLRKKLKKRLGYDAIDSKRFQGYRLEVRGAEEEPFSIRLHG